MIKLGYTSKTYLLVLVVVLWCIQGYSATRTASGNGSWSNTATWGGLSVPTSVDDVIIPLAINVTIDVNAFARSVDVTGTLTVNANISLTIEGNIDITGTLDIINAGGQTLIVKGNFANSGTATLNKADVIVLGNFVSTLASTIKNQGNLVIGGNASGIVDQLSGSQVYVINPNAQNTLSTTPAAITTVPASPAFLVNLINTYINSSSCGLTINGPSNANICSGNVGSFTIITVTPVDSYTYQWYENQGLGWVPLVNSGVYSGVNTATLNITGVPVVMDQYLYYCQISSTSCPSGMTSYPATLSVTASQSTPVFTLGTTSARCQGAGTITYSATASNTTGITYTIDAASISGGNSIVSGTGAVTYVAGWSGTSIVTASASGCTSPTTAIHTITVTPTVVTPAFILGSSSTRCQGAGSVTYTANATNSTGITYTLDAASITGGNSIDAGTGAVTYAAGWSGTSNITATAAGCSGPKTATHTVTITSTVGTPVFTLGATSTRCQGAGSVTYTANASNSTGIAYTLDAASITGGNSIVSGTGAVTYVAGWSGTSIITASATGCNGPSTTIHTVIITPTVSTPVFTLGATSTRCQGAGSVTYTVTATNSTGITYSLNTASITGGNSINSGTGAVTYVAGWSGSSIITASAAGCSGPKTATHTVTITPTVGTPVFTLGATSSRYQGAATVAYTATATNNTGITYSLDAASLAAGNTISSTTGNVTYTSAWLGTSIITASAAGCNGPKTSTHTVTILWSATYYSYQTGNWNQPTSWTFDPSGTTGPGTTVPGNNDKVVILSGRTITLTANVATTSHDITILAGGFLDESTFSFASLSALRGGGTLQLASANFPIVANNTFVTTDGGTTEYRTAGTFNLPVAQTTYYHLTINNSSEVAIQVNNLLLNGNLYVKSGTFQINDATANRRLLSVMGDVTIDNTGSITVGTGNTRTGADTPLSVANGGTSPFLNYYNNETHRIIIQGDLINNGTVRFTNQTAPQYDAFPITGAATVYFQGGSNNLLTCNGTTDFYNLVVDKGTDQTYKLTLYSNAYPNFRLFGANNAPSANTVANPDLKKALWVRNGTLVLQGLTVIPSLTEGTTAGPPASHYYIPANGALVLDGTEVIVLTTADDYTEVQAAYNLTGGSNASYGINNGTSSISGLSILGKLQINNGYLSTRESAGILYWSNSSGQLILNGGTLDTKQIDDASGSNTGLITYSQSGGTAILRGRFQNTISYTIPENLTTPVINTVRSANGIDGAAGTGTFHLNTNLANGFIMSGGNISIYDVSGTTATSYAAFIGCPASNINVIGGTVQIFTTSGTGGADMDYLINSKAPFANLRVNRSSGTSKVMLNSNSIRVLQNFDLQTGVFDANQQDVIVGGNFTIAAGTTYTCTGGSANRTIFNGSANQNFDINLASALTLNKLKIEKPAGTGLTLTGTQSALNVSDSLMIINGGLNDNGKTISASGNIYNSGVHSGSGKIFMNSDLVQIIGGNGTGEFANLELNKPANGSISVVLNANTIINGTLTFSGSATGYKSLNIQSNNLLFSELATVSGAGSNRYIQTNGLLGDGGVTKTYSASAPSFTYQVGAPSVKHSGVPNYSPSTISISGTPTVYGNIKVVPVGTEHPNTTTKSRSLSYYWKVTSSGFTLGSATVTHGYTYSQNDIPVESGDVTETGLVAARYFNPTYSWTKGTTNDVDETNNIVGEPGTGTFLQDVAFIDGDYTAGDDNATNPFGTPTRYYSRQTGPWGTLSTWSLTSHTVSNPPAVVPGISDIVIIGGQDSVYLATANTTPNTDVRNCASLQIESGSALDIGFNPNCSFGTVRNHPNGNGNFRLTTSYTDQSTFAFPSGDFSDFNINLGTTELYSTNAAAGTTYWLPNGIISYGNLILSPLGGSNIIFPNNNLSIYGNLITRGQNADSWFCPAWNTNYPTAPATRVAKTITINGNLDIQGGALIFYGNAAITQNFVVYGDVRVAPNSALYVYDGATSQNMSIGGNLINNTVGTTAGGTTTVRKCDFSLLPVTFFGNTPASVTNTINNPLTVFSKVTVNKGNSQATTLTIDVSGTLTTPADNWLTLQNGTLRYMRTNPGTDFTISGATAFTIPATAGLYVDYPNAGNKNILIANSNNNTNDLYLFGKLTLLNGNIYVGAINGTTVNNNDIEYSSGGASTIDVRGGNLVVNGQIRRNPSNAGGILNYNQEGGSVRINGQSAANANAKLEVLNNGSSFNMSAGTLTFVKGGGTTFGDIYLRPQTGNITGGTILFTPLANGAQTYQIDANIPLNHMAISGTAGNVATAKLMVSPLVLNGDITIATNSIFNTNNINTTFNGNFINNVGVAGYIAGTNLTTFSASNTSTYLGAQTLTGATNFYNLTISPGASLTINNPCNASNNLTLSSGTLIFGSNLMLVSGNLINNARYTDSNLANSGIKLVGTTKQYISGNGSFGRLELNNGFGAQTLNDITLEENLVLTLGILDINQYLLSLGLQSNIQGAPFSVTKMIMTNGASSALGVRKLFPSGPSANFQYPLGTFGKYTPASLVITANNTVGYVQINNINKQHSAVLDATNALNYYWQVTSSGITGLSGSLLLNYQQSDVKGVLESNYLAARLIVPGTSWSMTNTVNTTTNVLTFNHTGSNNLGGEYTAGINTAFPPDIPVYTSNKNGNWTDKTIWTQTGGTNYPCPDGGPNGFIVIIDHEVTANNNYCLAYRTTINNKLKIVSPYFGHNLGRVDGNGTLYLEAGSFPAGSYTSFLDCSNNGTIEYGGSGTYTIVADLYTSIPNLLVSGSGTRVLPAKDLTICKSLKINGPSLDNSISNQKLIIQGTMEIISGTFNSGTGSNATVSFAGSVAQTIGGSLGNFTGANAFNNFEINNISGLSVNTSGAIEVKGELRLTNGLINTNPSAPWNCGTLTLTNTAIDCVIPAGGSSSSFVNGPLSKNINHGDEFLFPVGIFKTGIGNVAGNKLRLSSSKTGTILWTSEYKNPNPTFASFTSPLEGVSSKEYWSIKALAGSKAIVNLTWNPDSDITPLVTINGLPDMRVSTYKTGTSSWEDIASSATGDLYNGVVSTNGTVTSGGSNDYTLASLTIIRPKAKLDPLGPVCGNSGIPVSIVTLYPIAFNYTLGYTINGVAQTPVTISSLPFILPTPTPGIYKLTSFTYNNGAGTGVVDANTITVNTTPTTSDAGPDQSLCGITSAYLDANPLGITVGTGIWTIISGNGGTLITPTSRTSQFIGLNGTTYRLRWTISNGSCKSTDDVFINFTLVPLAPVAPANQTLCENSILSDIIVTAPTGSTITWFSTSTGGSPLASSLLLASGDYFAESNGGTGCLSVSRTKVTVTIVAQVWTGAVNTDWNVAGNWSCGRVPDLALNAQIPNVANKPILSSGAAGTVKNIVIAGSSSVTISNNTLQIAGTITNSGTFTATAGTIEMKGTAAQTIGSGVFAGNTIKGLTINNAAGVTLGGPLNVTAVVNALSGNLASGGNLTLISTVTQTALIDGTGTGTITGNVTMQRYLPSGFGYKYISSPFQAATVNELATEVDLGASFPNLYQYDEDNHRDSSGVAIYTTGWSKYVTPASLLVPMKGYAANTGNVAAAKTISITGAVSNNILTTQTLYNHNRAFTKGFNLVGNPYPSPIDWNASNGWTKNNIDNALYFFDNGITNQYTGTYSSYINGFSTGTAGNIIASMQGFFIHVSNGAYPVSAALGMDNRVRVNNLSPVYHKSDYAQYQPIVRLAATFENEKTADQAIVYFDDQASDSFDHQLDALKLMNTDVTVPNFYAVTPQTERLSISAIPYPVESISKYPLGIKTEKSDWILMSASTISDLPSGLRVYLSDEATGMVQDLQAKPQYRIYLNSGTVENRFALLFSEQDLENTTKDEDLFYAYIANTVLNVYAELATGDEAQLVISNLLGQKMYKDDHFKDGLHQIDAKLPAGMYVITLYSQKGITSTKIYIPK